MNKRQRKKKFNVEKSLVVDLSNDGKYVTYKTYDKYGCVSSVSRKLRDSMSMIITDGKEFATINNIDTIPGGSSLMYKRNVFMKILKGELL